MSSWWPVSRRTSLRAARSHTRMVLSLHASASVFLSGEKARRMTDPMSLVNEPTSRSDATSQIRTVASSFSFASPGHSHQAAVPGKGHGTNEQPVSVLLGEDHAHENNQAGCPTGAVPYGCCLGQTHNAEPAHRCQDVAPGEEIYCFDGARMSFLHVQGFAGGRIEKANPVGSAAAGQELLIR